MAPLALSVDSKIRFSMTDSTSVLDATHPRPFSGLVDIRNTKIRPFSISTLMILCHHPTTHAPHPQAPSTLSFSISIHGHHGFFLAGIAEV